MRETHRRFGQVWGQALLAVSLGTILLAVSCDRSVTPISDGEGGGTP